jgi:hypothetical protein
MILVGSKNDTHVVASISWYDCVARGEGDQFILHDGGQPGTSNYSGYGRFSGKSVLIEIPQTYDELYNDYQFNRPRKYGTWKIEDVRILNEKEIEDFYKKVGPDRENDHYIYENTLWGTRGKNGDEQLKYVLLKDCDIDHLYAIKDTQRVSHDMTLTINYWISKKSGH